MNRNANRRAPATGCQHEQRGHLVWALLPLTLALGACHTPSSGQRQLTVTSPSPASRHDVIQELFHMDGTEQKLQNLNRVQLAIHHAWDRAYAGLGEDDQPPRQAFDAWQTRWDSIARCTFDSTWLMEFAVRRMSEKVDLPVLDGLRRWYHGALESKVRQARGLALTPVGQQRMSFFVTRLLGRPPVPERAALLTQLVEDEGEPEILYLLSHELSRRWFATMLQSPQAPPPFPADATPAANELDNDAFAQQMRKSLQLEAWFLHRALSHDEVVARADFWASAPAQRYRRARREMVEELIDAAMQRSSSAPCRPPDPRKGDAPG